MRWTVNPFKVGSIPTRWTKGIECRTSKRSERGGGVASAFGEM